MRKLDAMFIELKRVLDDKGVHVNVEEVKELMDYNEHEQENEFYYQRMVDKMEYERALNMYNGLANAIKIVAKAQMQERKEVA